MSDGPPAWPRPLGDTVVGVIGGGALGALVVAGLRIGGADVRWIGRPTDLSRAIVTAALLDGERFPSTTADFAIDVSTAEQLDWTLGAGVHVLIDTSDSLPARIAAAGVAGRRRIRLLSGSARDGGTFTTGPLRVRRDANASPPDPAVALMVAAVLVDCVRELCEPRSGLQPSGAALGFAIGGRRETPQRPAVVGVGGIGTWAALALAALGVPTLTLVDDDVVEFSNLARQPLFTRADARARRPKVEAASTALAKTFPATQTIGVRRCVDAETLVFLLRDNGADVLIGCVDNAPARLSLQHAAQAVGIPLVNAGTEAFHADCFVQTSWGRPLDEQLLGRLTRRDAAALLGDGCRALFVSPGMAAAAMIAKRVREALGSSDLLPPLRWRSGALPFEATLVS